MNHEPGDAPPRFTRGKLSIMDGMGPTILALKFSGAKGGGEAVVIYYDKNDCLDAHDTATALRRLADAIDYRIP